MDEELRKLIYERLNNQWWHGQATESTMNDEYTGEIMAAISSAWKVREAEVRIDEQERPINLQLSEDSEESYKNGFMSAATMFAEIKSNRIAALQATKRKDDK